VFFGAFDRIHEDAKKKNIESLDIWLRTRDGKANPKTYKQRISGEFKLTTTEMRGFGVELST